MGDFDAAEQAVRAVVDARFPKARESAKGGRDLKTARITLKGADPATPANRRAIKAGVEQLDFPPRGPVLWSMSRAGDDHFILSAWRTF